MDGDSTKVRPARKRADGEGTMRQRKDGTWEARLMVGYLPDGKADRRSVYGKTQQECRRKLAELRQKVSSGMLTDRTKQGTLDAFLTRWLAGITASVRSPTHARYSQLLRLHVVPTLGRKPLEALRPDDEQRLYAALLLKPAGPRRPGVLLSARTVHHVHVVLHTALEQAVKWGYVPRNACDVVSPPRVARSTSCLRRHWGRHSCTATYIAPSRPP